MQNRERRNRMKENIVQLTYEKNVNMKQNRRRNSTTPKKKNDAKTNQKRQKQNKRKIYNPGKINHTSTATS